MSARKSRSKKRAKPFVVDEAPAHSAVKLVEEFACDETTAASDDTAPESAGADASAPAATASDTSAPESAGADASAPAAIASDTSAPESAGADASAPAAIASDTSSQAGSDIGAVNVSDTKPTRLVAIADALLYWTGSKLWYEWIWSVRAPMLLLFAIALAPKFVLLWILIVIAKPVCTWLYRYLPESWKAGCKRSLSSLPGPLRQSSFLRDFREGADQSLPFILFWLYMFVVPFAIGWMAIYWVRGFLAAPEPAVVTENGFVFTQNKKSDSAHTETNFYYSRVFGLVVFAFFLLGAPAFFSYAVYEKLGIEKMMQGTQVVAVKSEFRSFLPAPPLLKPGLAGPPHLKTLGEAMQESSHHTTAATADDAHADKPDGAMANKQDGAMASKQDAAMASKQDAAMAKKQDAARADTVKMDSGKTKPMPPASGSKAKMTKAKPSPPPPLARDTAPQIVEQDDPDFKYVDGYSSFWPGIRSFGLEPTKASVFFVHFYLMGLATALCVLFFRAWFLFPLNFLTDEHDVEFTESGIKKKTLKGWFFNAMTINGWAVGRAGPDSFTWDEVKSLRQTEEGFTKLCPLPETAFKKESLTYKMLNKLAAFIDGLSHRSAAGNFLVFSSKESGGDFGNNIQINLNDLNREQRARLFYSVKKWAPHVVIKKEAEEQLLGSTVLHHVRYTQLWFDMLTAKTSGRKRSVLADGERLKNDEYTIDERISTGGQATTYRATKASGEKCVLKEFILATSSSSGALIESAREFEAEVSLLSQLNHPGIVRLEDFFAEDGRVYVGLEYIDGQTLRQRVQQAGPLSQSEVIKITQSICNVLEYLHKCDPPIVHRDITPENILVQADGSIKIIDFSLAVRQDGRQTTDSCAKQCFTPPEQFQEKVCVQSDIYALGATMYYLLTGAMPKPISVSSPKTKEPDLSDVLNRIVERATELDLNQRYESVHWLMLDLDSCARESRANEL